jgi:hypothetical protein
MAGGTTGNNTVTTTIPSTQAFWISGFELATSNGLCAVQAVFATGPGSSSYWAITAYVAGLETATTSATVRVFYTYVA